MFKILKLPTRHFAKRELLQAFKTLIAKILKTIFALKLIGRLVL